MANRSDITPELCRQLLEYEPETGKLYWKARSVSMFTESRWRQARRTPNWAANVWNTNNAGLEAFTATSRGYKVGAIFRVNFPAHRVAWAIFYGEWPTALLDHINGDPSDNRIANLRDVSNQENHRNEGLSKNNKTGVIGVSWDRQTDRWRAWIKVDYRTRNLGRYDTLEQASAVRAAAEKRYGFHPMHGRRPAFKP